MTGPQFNADFRMWQWKDQDIPGARDVLILAGERLYCEKHMQPLHLNRLLETLGAQPGEQDVLRASKELKQNFRTIAVPLSAITRAEYVPLLTAHLVRLRHPVEGKQKTLSLKLPAEGSAGAELFEELRVVIAPAAQVRTETTPRRTAIYGPLGALIFGGAYLLLLALASTSQDRAWQERFAFVYALFGWLIRAVGPVWWMIIAAIWIGCSALLLRSRIKKPPTMQVWER